MRCTCAAHALHMRCTCAAHALHMHCTCTTCIIYEGGAPLAEPYPPSSMPTRHICGPPGRQASPRALTRRGAEQRR
eukprot:scaffold107169_cov53-Phaeocystis_antarctica.AAC.2